MILNTHQKQTKKSSFFQCILNLAVVQMLFMLVVCRRNSLIHFNSEHRDTAGVLAPADIFVEGAY